MNLRPSDSERRLQMQQADVAPTPGKRAPNPFAAALGIGVLVSLIWLFFALGRAFQELVVLLHKGVNLTHFPF
jgi:hypothetical protein